MGKAPRWRAGCSGKLPGLGRPPVHGPLSCLHIPSWLSVQQGPWRSTVRPYSEVAGSWVRAGAGRAPSYGAQVLLAWQDSWASLGKTVPPQPQRMPGRWPERVLERWGDWGRRPGEAQGPSGPQGPRGAEESGRHAATRWRHLPRGARPEAPGGSLQEPRQARSPGPPSQAHEGCASCSPPGPRLPLGGTGPASCSEGGEPFLWSGSGCLSPVAGWGNPLWALRPIFPGKGQASFHNPVSRPSCHPLQGAPV